MRQLSATALQATLAQRTGEVFLPFLKIEHSSLANTILVVYNTESITRTDGVYQPYPFTIMLPDQNDNGIPMVSVKIDNTDVTTFDGIRVLVGAPKVTMFIALADTPNTIEVGPFVYSLTSMMVDMNSIQGTLGFEDDVFSQNAPGQTYTPTNSRGLFL